MTRPLAQPPRLEPTAHSMGQHTLTTRATRDSHPRICDTRREAVHSRGGPRCECDQPHPDNRRHTDQATFNRSSACITRGAADPAFGDALSQLR